MRALDGLELEIGGGEFVVVAGPSGSGKSTLLQLLGALDRPTGGEVLFEGRDLARMGEGELAELRLRTVGFVFQQFNLIPTLTAAENVEIAIAPTGLARRRAPLAHAGAARAGRAGEPGGASALAALRRRAAAGGDRAGARQPSAGVLADEPTGNLDTASGDAILPCSTASGRRRA